MAFEAFQTGADPAHVLSQEVLFLIFLWLFTAVDPEEAMCLETLRKFNFDKPFGRFFKLNWNWNLAIFSGPTRTQQPGKSKPGHTLDADSPKNLKI